MSRGILRMAGGLALTLTLCAGIAMGADWPMFRNTSNHMGASSEELPANLYLRWVRGYATPTPAWDNQQEQYCYGGPGEPVQQKQSFDIAYQPIVAGGKVFVGSMTNDTMTALDLTTGAELWKFYANGPIRFAPVAKNGKVYFGSDDGYVYCLDAADGSVVWQRRVAPRARKIMGNDRLVSVWPVRGAPVIPTADLTYHNSAYDAWVIERDSATPVYVPMTNDDDMEEAQSDGSIDAGSSDLEINNESAGGGNKQIVGIRFSNAFYRIPQGATIASASVTFTVDETKGGTDACNVTVYGEDSGASAPFTSATNDISSRTKTTASAAWDIPNWTTVGAAGADQTVDVTAIVQEIVNRGDFTDASPITIIIEPSATDVGVRCAESKDGDGVGPQLNITCAAMYKDNTAGEPPQDIVEANTDDNVVYCAAGLYSFEGVFVYALDADTGDVVWLNDGEGMFFTLQPHGTSEGFSGLAPQGYLCTGYGDKLLVPNGRALPACFDRTTGQMEYLRLGGMSKGLGGYHVVSQGDLFCCRDTMFNLSNGGKSGGTAGASAEWDEDHLQIQVGSRTYTAGQLNDRTSASYTVQASDGSFSAVLDGKPAGLLAADGNLIVSTMNGKIYCYGETPLGASYPYQPASPRLHPLHYLWAQSILARAGYQDGSRGICIVAGLTNGFLLEELAKATDLTIIGFDASQAKVDWIRRRLDARGLYGHKIHLIPEDFASAEVPPYCAQIVTCESWNPDLMKDCPEGQDCLGKVYRTLRPFGGTAVLNAPSRAVKQMTTQLQASDPEFDADVTFSSMPRLCRTAALPDTVDWTHQHGNVQQTTLANDDKIKLPLGILWFGGSSDNTNDKILPRHGHGPSPQICEGRLYIEGRDILRCNDVYTGRVLWEKTITNLGQFSDYTDHQGGQLALGDNYVATPDAVYVLGTHADNEFPLECHALDPVTGATLDTYTLPGGEPWGAIAVYGDYLIAPADPMLQDTTGYDNDGVEFESGSGWIYQDSDPEVGVGGMGTYNGSTSSRIYVLNRADGSEVWHTDASYGFFHNSIVAGEAGGTDILFAMDRINWDPTDPIEDRLIGKSGGNPPPAAADETYKEATLTAFDITDGTVVWQTTHNDYDLFGAWLAYSDEHDILIECQRSSRDYWESHLSSHLMRAWDGDGDGAGNEVELWFEDRFYWGGPVMLQETATPPYIITQSGNDMSCVELLTGAVFQIPSPLDDAAWEFQGFKRYGCGTSVASTHMLSFRSGAAGYLDLDSFAGTGNFGGFKLGCTISAIPANGVLNSPEYTRTCGCSYQIQTSCALVHNPDVDIWTCNKNLGEAYAASGGGKITHGGINFGAPGDRVDGLGILWMEYPFGEPVAPGGPFNYEIPVNVTVTPTGGNSAMYFRRHSLSVNGSDCPWIAASGVENVQSIVIDMVNGGTSSGAESYTVYLYFMEPDGLAAGARVFDVSANGVSTGAIDIASEAGAYTILKKTLNNVQIDTNLTLSFTVSAGQPIICGVGMLKD